MVNQNYQTPVWDELEQGREKAIRTILSPVTVDKSVENDIENGWNARIKATGDKLVKKSPVNETLYNQ